MTWINYILICIILLGASRAEAGFVTDWNLGVLVRAGNVDTQNSVFEDVENPFSNSHFLDVLSSTAAASYEFSWDESGGNFNIGTDFAVAAVPGISRRVSVGGSISFFSPHPLLIGGVSAANYDLTGDPMSISTIALVGIPGGEELAAEIATYSTSIDGPRSGRLLADIEPLMVPANEIYTFAYATILDTSSNVMMPNLASGTGTVSINVTVLPEPMTAALLAAVITPLLRRRRSR